MSQPRTDRELMQQALDALAGLLVFNPSPDEYRQGRDAVTALRSRLAQPEQEPKHYPHTWGKDGERCVVCGDKDWMGTSCKKISVPQPPQRTEQEPITLPDSMTPEMLRKVQMHSELGAYAAENWANAYDVFHEFWRVAVAALPTAPQRKPLTDEWIHRTTVLLGFNPEWTTEIGIAHAIVRAAEAAHGIKGDA